VNYRIYSLQRKILPFQQWSICSNTTTKNIQIGYAPIPPKTSLFRAMYLFILTRKKKYPAFYSSGGKALCIKFSNKWRQMAASCLICFTAEKNLLVPPG
jgi:hypothetical protein